MNSEITGLQYADGRLQYWRLLRDNFSREDWDVFPKFSRFCLLEGREPWPDGTIQLSITGKRRFEMLYSPHAVTLLKAYRARINDRTNNDNSDQP